MFRKLQHNLLSALHSRRLTARQRKGLGRTVTFIWKCSFCLTSHDPRFPSAGSNDHLWNNVVTYRNNLDLARDSPTHCRLPIPNGSQLRMNTWLLGKRQPWSSRNLSGLNVQGSPQIFSSWWTKSTFPRIRQFFLSVYPSNRMSSAHSWGRKMGTGVM